MSLEDIKKDIVKQEFDSVNRYDLTEGTHILLLDLNSKEKEIIDWVKEDKQKKLYYHKFKLKNQEGKFVLFSNYLYAEFLKVLTPHINNIDPNNSVIEVILNVSKQNNKTNYEIKINKGE